MLSPGSKLGRFTIVGTLGTGGMGVVHRALEDGTGREVALKVLAPELARDERFLERFRREARAASRVVHPHVVAWLASGEERGTPWIAFELVPGGSLASLVRRDGRLPWRETARLGAEIARGLAAIHAAGLVHRDVKPANILLDARGHARVADLGLARVRDGTSSLTATGEVVGTFEYLAPELAASGDVGPRADLYGLGATLYEALAGAPPFAGRGVDVVAKHVLAAPAPVSDHAPEVPPALDALVRRLLAKRPEERGAGALEVAAELEALAATRARSRAPRVLGALLVVAALAAAGVALRAARRATPHAETPPPSVPAAASPSPRAPPSGDWFLALSESERTERTVDGVKPLPARDRFVHEATGIVLVFVPGTTFVMGEGALAHEVTLSPYFVGETEVTNAEFAAWAEQHPTVGEKGGGMVFTGESWAPVLERRSSPSWRRPESGVRDALADRPDHPVVQVLWREARAFVLDNGLDLPTEAQWECAAAWDPRARRTRTHPWGDGAARVNLADASFERALGFRALVARDDGAPTTAGVRAFREDVSALGVLGMGGGVAEWVRDKYHDTFESLPARDPCCNDPDAPLWVVRGGSWTSGLDAARCTARRGDAIGRGDLGFRVALGVPRG